MKLTRLFVFLVGASVAPVISACGGTANPEILWSDAGEAGPSAPDAATNADAARQATRRPHGSDVTSRPAFPRLCPAEGGVRGPCAARSRERPLDRLPSRRNSMHEHWVHANPRRIDGPAVVRALLDAAW